MSDEIVLDGSSLGLDTLRKVASERPFVRLSPDARRVVDASRAVIDAAVRENRVVYGVTTGFGRFADVVIPVEALEELQMNLVRSHAAGVGEPLDVEVVRAMMLLRANCLAKGYSGVKSGTLELLLDLLNRGIHPVIPSQGSVGASGDL